MRGKYSPTVTEAYMMDQAWFDKYAKSDGDEFALRDPEGFDLYGYNDEDMDRAGNYEHEYYHNDAPEDSDEDYNWLYMDANDHWTFDGVKPVRRTVDGNSV